MIHYLSLRINAQATGDTEKVRSTVRILLPPHKSGIVSSGSDIISESVNKVHYSNQIRRDEAVRIARTLFSIED